MKYVQIFESYLNEASIRELLSDSNRGKNPLKSKAIKYKGFAFRSKNVYFEIGDYEQTVKLQDLKIVSKMSGDDKDKVSMAMDGDIKVMCTCPDFLYGGFKYIGTVLDYSTHPENRFPEIKNPNEEGTVCKHLHHLLKHVHEYVDDIVEDIESSRKTKWYKSSTRK